MCMEDVTVVSFGKDMFVVVNKSGKLSVMEMATGSDSVSLLTSFSYKVRWCSRSELVCGLGAYIFCFFITEDNRLMLLSRSGNRAVKEKMLRNNVQALCTCYDNKWELLLIVSNDRKLYLTSIATSMLVGGKKVQWEYKANIGYRVRQVAVIRIDDKWKFYVLTENKTVMVCWNKFISYKWRKVCENCDEMLASDKGDYLILNIKDKGQNEIGIVTWDKPYEYKTIFRGRFQFFVNNKCFCAVNDNKEVVFIKNLLNNLNLGSVCIDAPLNTGYRVARAYKLWEKKWYGQTKTTILLISTDGKCYRTSVIVKGDNVCFEKSRDRLTTHPVTGMNLLRVAGRPEEMQDDESERVNYLRTGISDTFRSGQRPDMLEIEKNKYWKGWF